MLLGLVLGPLLLALVLSVPGLELRAGLGAAPSLAGPSRVGALLRAGKTE